MSTAASQKSPSKPAQVLKDSDFNWEDPLDLEGELTEEERMVRDSARAFSQDKLMPRVRLAWREEKVDKELLPEMGALGLLGPTIPEEYGGAGLGYVAYGLIAREMERVDSGYRSTLSVQSSLVMHPIYAYGTEAQQQKYLPKLAKAELIGCFGLTEPDYGSDPGSMVTRAEKVPAASSSTAPRCGSPTRRSPTSPSSGRSSTARSAASSSSAAPRDSRRRRSRASCRCAPRSPARSCWKTPSCRRTICCRTCRASPARSAASTWRATASPGARWAPPNSAGTARGNTCSTASSSTGRSPPTSSCRRSSPTCRPRSRSACTARCGSAACWRQGKAAPPSISLMKRNNCGKALDIARVARDMHGGNGISDEFHVMRVMCNLETVNTYEGTHDIHALILGRAQTGIQAFF